MTLFFYPDSSDWQQRVRLGRGFSFTEAAESGTYAMSTVIADDPDSSLTIVGHHAFRVVESACSWKTLFRGYFADRTIGRSDDDAGSLRTGVARVWDATVYDANATLQFEVIRGNGGKRPKETDTERLAWILGSTFKGPISDDDTNVLGYDVDLDKADYRGQTMADVLADCASMSKANFFVTWDETVGDSGSYVLHYYKPDRSYYSSDIKISNVLSDVNGSTVFAPSADTKLNKDPSRVFSGVYYQYGEKESAVFRESASVLAAIGHKRETSEQDEATRREARAERKADNYLEEADTDYDVIRTTLHRVPPSVVNLIRIGQRMQVKFSHLPGYTSYTWLRIKRRTVSQDGDTQLFYKIDLELADPKQLGAHVRRKAKTVEPDIEDGAAVAFTRRHFKAQQGRDDNQGGVADDYNYGTGSPNEVESACRHFTPYIFVGCPFGEAGYSGVDTIEQWFEVTGTPSADAHGIRVDYTCGTPEGVAANWWLNYGIAHQAPDATTGVGAFFILGQCDVSGGSFIIPTSMLTGGDNFIVIGPGWTAGSLENRCAGTFTGGEPINDGAGNSGSVALNTVTFTEVTSSGTGLGVWSGMSGAIDGLNRVFALPGWNSKGIPHVRIGGIELSYGPDFDYDDDALEVTLTSPPWEGADLAGRWNK